MDIYTSSLVVGRELLELEVRTGILPSPEQVGRRLVPQSDDVMARNIARVISAHIGKEVGNVRTTFQMALKLGISQEVFIGWLRDRTEQICRSGLDEEII